MEEEKGEEGLKTNKEDAGENFPSFIKAPQVTNKPTKNLQEDTINQQAQKKIPKTELNQLPKGVEYKQIKRFDLKKFFNKKLPDYMKPTQLTAELVGAVVILVVLFSLLTFPYGAIIKGQTDVRIKVGLPLSFLVFNLENVEENPLKPVGLIIDLLIYLVIAYILEIIIKLSLRAHKLIPKDESEKPVVYADAKKPGKVSLVKAIIDKFAKKKTPNKPTADKSRLKEQQKYQKQTDESVSKPVDYKSI